MEAPQVNMDQHPICFAHIEIVKAHGFVDGISRAGLTVILRIKKEAEMGLGWHGKR